MLEPDMKDMKDAFSAEVMAELSRPPGLRHQRANGGVDDIGEVHCFDPWWIASVKPGMHRAAKESLTREGFEVYYPQGRLLTRMPFRFIGPKKRRMKQLVLREDVRQPYGDYIFLRRLWGSYSLLRLFDLNGVRGLCLFGETPALIEDFEVELLRLAEFDGEFDECGVAGITAKQLRLAEIKPTRAAEERGKTEPVTHTILDSNRRTLVFVEAFGRITRVVAGKEDLPAARMP